MANGAGFAWPADAVEIGRVTGAWGVKGWIRVSPHSSDPLALRATKHWFIKPPADPDGGTRLWGGQAFASPLTIVQSKQHGDGVVAQVQGVHERVAAEALRGARIFVSRQDFPPVAADEYYWVDLIGLTVLRRQGERLGTVVGLLNTGPHSVLRVAPDAVPDGKTALDVERLIPFTAVHIDSVSLAERRITVDWGLDY